MRDCCCSLNSILCWVELSSQSFEAFAFIDMTFLLLLRNFVWEMAGGAIIIKRATFSSIPPLWLQIPFECARRTPAGKRERRTHLNIHVTAVNQKWTTHTHTHTRRNKKRTAFLCRYRAQRRRERESTICRHGNAADQKKKKKKTFPSSSSLERNFDFSNSFPFFSFFLHLGETLNLQVSKRMRMSSWLIFVRPLEVGRVKKRSEDDGGV